MFDWNDEELTNIIWGEAEEGEDHIVPHPDANQEKHSDILRNHVKNERNQDCVNLKPKELTKSVIQNTSHGIKAESCSPDGDALSKTQYSLDVVDPILTLSEKVAHDSEGTETYNKVFDISSYEPKSEVETASEIFQSPLEESEQSDFVDYGWASVGSFENLDRIFSNEDPILGNASLGIAEDLWTSCRDGTGSSEKSYFLKDDPQSSGISPLRNKAEQCDVEADFLSDENQSFTPCHGKFSAFASCAPRDRNWFNENAGSSNGEKHLSNDKTALETGQSYCLGSLTDNTLSVAETNESMDKKKLLKSRKRVNEDGGFHGLEQGSIGHQNRYIQSHSPYAPAVGQPSVSLGFTQQMPHEVPSPSQLKYMSSPLTPVGNVANGYAILPSLSPFHSLGVGLHPTVASSYEVSHRPHEVPCRPFSMTPQEKIEKLRRKQQMRAMLAIQRQKCQFGSGESANKYSALDGENCETEPNLLTFDSSLDLNSLMQQDLSNKARGMVLDESLAADRILYQLQDTISKLDMQVRLSMRDSLYRLANSASQRRYACGTSSNHFDSRTEANTNEESNVHIRFPETCNVETETNPIDRTVAHLLFYQPMENHGKHVEAKSTSSIRLNDSLESPLSAKGGRPYDIKSTSAMISPADYFEQKSKSKQIHYHHNKHEVSALFPESGNLKKSSCMESSEITSDE